MVFERPFCSLVDPFSNLFGVLIGAAQGWMILVMPVVNGQRVVTGMPLLIENQEAPWFFVR